VVRYLGMAENLLSTLTMNITMESNTIWQMRVIT
jgi:hypothetical protein